MATSLVTSYLKKKKTTADPLWTLNRFSFRTTPVHRLHFVFYTHSRAYYTHIHSHAYARDHTQATTKRKLKYTHTHTHVSFCFLTILGHTSHDELTTIPTQAFSMSSPNGVVNIITCSFSIVNRPKDKNFIWHLTFVTNLLYNVQQRN